LIQGGYPSINPTTLASSNGGELGHVVSIFSDLHSLISNCTPITPVHKPSSMPTVHRLPSAPTAIGPTATSPTPFTPLLLSQFLEYSQDHLGIRNAISYGNVLLWHDYSPDILHKVPSKDLENLDISAGADSFPAAMENRNEYESLS